ncbi:hypothetical protein [Bdellovibrio sp. NC01]|uniref:hypothetical protein n=1 Tax=Bdellovibrio sp. NC01 TaxID=2220073 RepID=UPI00115C3C33|nr:hypothetical protein [Bdellovibrio sp. NC01]QDK39227.1 hypothetical protein DOE51_17340 [Bdellovibrio sp. NC01]
MKHKSSLLILGISLVLMDCTGKRASTEASSSSATSSAKTTTTYSSAENLQIAQSLANVVTSDRQSLMAIQQGTCVNVDYNLKTDIHEDKIFRVGCTNIEGTIEVISDNANNEKTYEITTDLTYSDDVNTSRVDSSFYSIKISADQTEYINKDFSEVFKTNGKSYELSGSSNYVFTPDEESEDALAGDVSIESTVYFSKDQADLKYFDVATYSLHKSACGIDRGILALSNADVSYQIVYSGCGKFKVKENNVSATASFY